jgi:hypothetical protein
MMNSFLRTLSLLGVFLGSATVAHAADGASGEIQLKGIAPRVCQMPDPTAVNSGNASFQNMAVTVNQLLNEQDSTVLAWQASLNYPGVMCNYAATLSLRSLNGGMKPTGPALQVAGGAFLTQVNYTATAKWGTLADVTLNTATNGVEPVSIQSPGPNKGDLTITLQTPASTTPLITGQFQDTLIIKVGPAV